MVGSKRGAADILVVAELGAAWGSAPRRSPHCRKGGHVSSRMDRPPQGTKGSEPRTASSCTHYYSCNRGEKSTGGVGGEISSVQKSESLSIHKIFPKVMTTNERRPTICFLNASIHKHIHILKAERHI